MMVIEKGAEIGNHGISGAVLDPIAPRELSPIGGTSAGGARVSTEGSGFFSAPKR